MEIKKIIIMTSEEVSARIPFRELVESWNSIDTFSVRRMMGEVGISKNELLPLYEKARKWYLRTGVPQNAEFSPSELIIWDKVGQFIAKMNRGLR